MRNRHFRTTTVARILHSMPSYLPGSVMRSQARDLASQHHPEPCKTTRELRCCTLSPGSRFSFSISHSHPPRSLTPLMLPLFHSQLLGCHPQRVSCRALPQSGLVLTRKAATFTASFCNSPAHLPSANYTISDPASCTRQLSPLTSDHHKPTHRPESICAHKHMSTCAADFRCDCAKPPTSPAHHSREHRSRTTPM